jgi:transcriptional adapter 3
MVSSTNRKSPTPHDSHSSYMSPNLKALASSIEIPTNVELLQLVAQLQERKAKLVQRRRKILSDEGKLPLGRISKEEVSSTSLLELLDGTEEQNAAFRHISSSPISKTIPLVPASPSRGRSGYAAAALSVSPGPSGTQDLSAQTSGSSRLKTRVERDPDQEREGSEAAAATVASSAVSFREAADATTSTRYASEASLDPDWDEEGPSRPGRIHHNKRKRQKTSQNRDQDEQSHSEVDSPQPSASRRTSPHRESSVNGRALGGGPLAAGPGSSSSSIKLKLNPTAHTALVRNDPLSASIHRASLLRGRDDFASVMSPMQASQAALWELPKKTSEAYVPSPPIPKAIRWYPTKPEEVDVDFAKMDWKERDKERDRLEAAAASNGPAPGQAIVKESTAASRARDRKQDQVAHHIFLQNTDAWFRTVTEEDLAYLSSERDASEALQNPPLGRHYSEVWEEEEANGIAIHTTYFTKPAVTGAAMLASNQNGANTHANGTVVENAKAASASSFQEITSKQDIGASREEKESGTPSDDALAGPFTERLLAALLPIRASGDGAIVHTSESGSNGSIHHHLDEQGYASNNNQNHKNTNLNHNVQTYPPATHPNTTSTTTSNGSLSSQSNSNHISTTIGPNQSMTEYETRIRAELKAIGLVEEDEMDWSQRADDEVSSTLRKVQRLLEKQIQTNAMRKSKLFGIAKDRLAYQDYLACLFSTEREIETGWLKRQTQIKKSMQAQKKKKGGSSGTTNAAALPVLNGLISSDGPGGVVNSSSPATGGGASTPGGGGGVGMAASSSSLGHPPPTATDRGGGPMAPQFSDALLAAVERRRLLKHAFDPMFDSKPRAIFTPRGDDSIYKDVDL